MAEIRAHRRSIMGGRDPSQPHRASTPLELLFDLTFVIAFGTASDELAHAVAADHVGAGLTGFGFATFAISWAWINFSWFASAYDTDDWVFRLTTMLQMGGVLVLALGLPAVFESITAGEHVDDRVVVAGYVVMRVAMVLQWLRASRQDPARRRACLTYATAITVAQVGWVALAVADTSVGVVFVWAALLVLVEMAGPALVERRKGGTPWHPHHIAERYGLLVIIALGEGLLGTTAALGAVVGPEGPGWSADAVVLGLAGTALIFGLWWTYFAMPSGDVLARHRDRSFGWGYGHIVLFGALVAVGAGLHTAAFRLQGASALGETATVLAVAVPVALYVGSVYALYAQLTRTLDPLHLLLLAGSAAVVAGAVALAAAGGSLAWALAVLALTPWVTVVAFETIGFRHTERALAGP